MAYSEVLNTLEYHQLVLPRRADSQWGCRKFEFGITEHPPCLAGLAASEPSCRPEWKYSRSDSAPRAS